MNMKIELPTCDDSLIRQVCLSVYQLPTVTVADEIGLFSRLEEIPLGIEELADKLSLTRNAVEALVTSLSALGLLVCFGGKYGLTDTSRNYLLPSKPFYWGHMLRLFDNIAVTHARLLEAVRRGEPVEAVVGKTLTAEWEQAQISDEHATVLTRAMHSNIFAAANGLARHAKLSHVKRLLDIAGGSGALCIALAQRHSQMKCTVAELPPVCKVTQEYIAQYGVKEQVDTLGLDMFRDTWPNGYDAIMMSNILHDWGKAKRHLLIKKSFEALPPGGSILIYEMLLADALDGPVTAALFSVNMLFLSEGKQFTASELDAELRACGFEDVSVSAMYAGYSLVSARKPR